MVNLAEENFTTTAIALFFMGIILLICVVAAIVFFDYKLVRRQSNAVPIYMEPLIKAQTIHSARDYRKASFAKSNYLLYKRTLVTVPVLAITIVMFVLLSYYYPSLPDFPRQPFDMSFWLYETFFGLKFKIVNVWGMNLWYALEQIETYKATGFTGWSFYVLLCNVLFLIFGLMFLWQLQGYAARFLAILRDDTTAWLNPQAPAAMEVKNNIINQSANTPS